jgi:hypothetical protein
MCAEDGPPLSVAGHMRWAAQLQSIYPVPGLFNAVLLGVLWEQYMVDMD